MPPKKKKEDSVPEVVTKVEEEEEQTSASEQSVDEAAPPPKSTVTYAAVEFAEEEFEHSNFFNVRDAWDEIQALPGANKFYMTQQLQEIVGLQVGVNLSQENPWKYVNHKKLAEKVFNRIDNGDKLRDSMKKIPPTENLLIGYIPPRPDDEDERLLTGDQFVIFGIRESEMLAGNIIRNIETFQRYKLNKALVKKGRGWRSKGSEVEVDRGVPPVREKLIDVEVQSVYPLRALRAPLTERSTSDVRDGYVELLPGEKKIENVFRKRVSIGIQSAAARISLEQQTDPTFPTNAWSQYMYEISGQDEGIEASDDDEKGKSKGTTPTPNQTPVPTIKPPKQMSEQIQNLLATLEFNQIDMYRNDYPHISSQDVDKYEVPYLEEILCFAKINKSFGRLICAIAWYPYLTGLVVSSYTFSTAGTSISLTDKTDVISRATCEPNPILLWSFDDTLNFKLEFKAPREVTALSFCPYDPKLLIGGTINGQVIIWDMGDRISKLDDVEVLTQAQEKYRELMNNFLSWTFPVNEDVIVEPAALSNIEQSQTGAIINIKWVDQKQYITKTGKIYTSASDTNRFFFTTAADGSVGIWNLDAEVDTKKRAGGANKGLPPQLVKTASEYSKFDRVWKPMYIIIHPEPLVGTLMDVALFESTLMTTAAATADISTKIPIKVEAIEQPKMRNMICAGTMFGSVCSFEWEGFDAVGADDLPKEKIQSMTHYPKVHDGPVVGMERNPFFRVLFATIGGSTLTIWQDNFLWTPVFWRVRPAILTSLEWSKDRPSILYITRDDGVLEIWDFFDRSDEAVLLEPLGGGVVSAITTQPVSASTKRVLGIGDYNSSFRMVVLPSAFSKPLPNEAELFKAKIRNELDRKTVLRAWETVWYQANADIREAKKLAEEAAIKELERLRKEAEFEAQRRQMIEAEAARKAAEREKAKAGFDLPQRLEKKWDDMILRRVMDILMEKKRVDPEKLEKETALEKDRLRYEKNKKLALKKNFSMIAEEVAAVRARLLPAHKEDLKREDMVMDAVTLIVEDCIPYEYVERDSEYILQTTRAIPDVPLNEIFEKGKERRKAINKAIGGNIERHEYYYGLKEMKDLYSIDFGYLRFCEKPPRKERPVKFLPKEEELDTIPVHDEEEEAQ